MSTQGFLLDNLKFPRQLDKFHYFHLLTLCFLMATSLTKEINDLSQIASQQNFKGFGPCCCSRSLYRKKVLLKLFFFLHFTPKFLKGSEINYINVYVLSIASCTWHKGVKKTFKRFSFSHFLKHFNESNFRQCAQQQEEGILDS